ncbi:MAG: spermidine/putrescine ABC transporter substrate-binding protein [Chloroflexota bacterium]|nr:spermidine/putrescine ABC transporter substrate-binding protein [Chloroflexota bacterium]
MKRFLLVLIVLLCAVLIAPVSAQDSTATPELEAWVCPEGYEGQTLNVYNWTIYIAEDTIPNFEAACGVDVVYDNYFTNEELLAKLQQGNPGYDVIVPSDYMIAIMIEEELLEPLNKDLIPNIANVSEDMLSPWYDEGNVYTMPYQWGTVGLAYNRTATGRDITSWEEFFNYEGNVAWLEDLRGMLGIGLLMSGYDVNSENPDEIDAARQYLLEHSGNVAAIVAGNSKQLLSQGEVDIAVDYNGNVFGLMAECAADPNCTTEYAYAIPVEGTSRWTDNLAIPVGAQNPTLANVFIDYILHPQVSADISNYVTYGTPNQAALDLGLINPESLENPNLYPPPEVRANLFQIRPVSPETEVLYNNAWDELKIAIGAN